MSPVFSESEDQKLFEELWDIPRLGRDYPALYRLYLKVATPERVRKIKQEMESPRIARLIADATPYKDSLQLRYKYRGFSSVFCGPPKSVCPPIDQLKINTRIRLILDKGRVIKVELVDKNKR